MMNRDDAARSAAARTARASYGRLIALLAASTGDLQLAEDALSAAFEQALRRWPESGVPSNPEGWLVTVARNRQRDVWKSAAYQRQLALDPAIAEDGHWPDTVDPFDNLDPDRIPDERLALMFVCAHPAIDAAVRTPLILQTVLGFEAAEIAEAYAVAPAAMAQRLVRAKKRIRDARIPFVVPSREVLPGRLAPVLEAIYGCYAIGFGPGTGSEMTTEAQYLAVTMAALLADEPEAWGLAALITLSMAREPARSSSTYLPLDEQDASRWNSALIHEGDAYLRRASGAQPGRFQLEAAIQSVHCARATSGRTDWAALRTLYEALIVVAPTLGAQVALAGAMGRVEGPEAGLRVLDDLGGAAAGFQPAWAVRAHLSAAAGRHTEARVAYDHAIELTSDPAVRRFLTERAAGSP
jgi:RNA polymerase sigma-70 factor (ECF subfamily)